MSAPWARTVPSYTVVASPPETVERLRQALEVETGEQRHVRVPVTRGGAAELFECRSDPWVVGGKPPFRRQAHEKAVTCDTDLDVPALGPRIGQYVVEA